MNVIKLHKRYPHSRQEDITDAYMRGFTDGVNALKAENAKLRKLCADMSRELAIKFAEETGDLPDESWEWYDRMRELRIEVPE